jgi:BetR domain.
LYVNVEAELRRKGITRAKLANQLGLAISTVSQKLTGKAEFTLAEAKEVKRLLGVGTPLDELFANDTQQPAS